MHILLDLDFTLIAAYESHEAEHDPKKFPDATVLDIAELVNYTVYKRPGLDAFFDRIFVPENRVSVFTAAGKDYALLIIAAIGLNTDGRILDNIFYHLHCDLSRDQFKNGNYKNLRLLYETLGVSKQPDDEPWVLIDDNAGWKVDQPDLVEIIKPFSPTETEEDGVLADMYARIQKHTQ